MSSKPEAPSVSSYCQQLDHSLASPRLRQEDPNVIRTIMTPLENMLVGFPECPELPDSPAGKIGIAVWARLHPQDADLELLLQYGHEELPLVRFAAASALQASSEEHNKRWKELSFAARARQDLQDWWDHEQSPTISFILKSLLNQSAKLARPLRRPRAPIRSNPYVAGVPIKDAEKFFGRQETLNEIAAKLGQTLGVKSLILYGARRSGKTSILLRIKSGALGTSFVPVYVDMQGFAGVDANVFLASLAQATVNAALETGMQVSQPQLPPSNTPEFRLAFQEVLKNLLKDSSRNLLIMIDEYEVLLEYVKNDPSLALQLQHLAEGEGNLCFVFAGSHTIEAVGKLSSVPLLDAARYLRITFLSRESALDLVTKPVQGLLDFAEGVPDRIVDLTAGHPFYTQLICQSLFDIAKASEQSYVTLLHLEQAVETFLREPPPHLILTWNGLQHEEKVAGSTLALLGSEARLVQPIEILEKLEAEDYPSVPKPGEVRDALRKLRDEGWIDERLPEGSYRFSMELVRRWVKANRSIEAMIDEQRKRLEKTAAPAWRQWSAELADVLFSAAAVGLGALCGETLGGFDSMASDTRAILGGITGALIYFVFPMMVGRFTIGLRLFNLYPSQFRKIAPLGRPRAGIYSLVSLLRILVVDFTIVWFITWATRGPDLRGTSTVVRIAVGVLGAFVVATDNILMRVATTRRGLYERLCGIILMYRR